MTNPEDYPGTGDLPDALAFVKPTRARAYIALDRADAPLTAAELANELDCAMMMAYRSVNDLKDIGLVTESIAVSPTTRPKTAFEPTDIDATPEVSHA